LKGNAQPASQAAPRWEYQVFTKPVSAREYEITSVPFDSGVPTTDGGNIAQEIERAVSLLLDRVSLEGWEPVEAVDSNSLWKAQHVTRRYKNKLLSMGVVIPTEVQIRCRRKVTGQPKSASNPSGALSAPTIKPVGSLTQPQPQIKSTGQSSSQRKPHGPVYFTIAYLLLGFGLFCVGGFIEALLVPIGAHDPITNIVYHTADEKTSKTAPALVVGVVCLLIGIGMLSQGKK
jgi:hypothetical protein